MVGRGLAQERLDFQLEQTLETTTSRAGLALFQEAALVSGVRKSIRAHLPAAGSNHGLKPEECVAAGADVLRWWSDDGGDPGDCVG